MNLSPQQRVNLRRQEQARRDNAGRAMLATLKGIASLVVAYENDPKEMAFQISLAANRVIALAEAAGITVPDYIKMQP
jgi:hypothetical protein